MNAVARLYQRSCARKQRYPNERAARRALRHIRRRHGRALSWLTLSVYACVFCGGFHHGHGLGNAPLVTRLRAMGSEAAMALIHKEAA